MSRRARPALALLIALAASLAGCASFDQLVCVPVPAGALAHPDAGPPPEATACGYVPGDYGEEGAEEGAEEDAEENAEENAEEDAEEGGEKRLNAHR